MSKLKLEEHYSALEPFFLSSCSLR